MSSTEIVTFEKATALTGKKAIDFFTKPENVEPIIQQVQTEALSLVPNVKTKAGRDEIGSTALKVSKSRKAIVEAIERSVADLKSQVQAANEVKKLVESELNETRRQVLQPRNEWQAEQDRIEAERVAEIKTRIENIQAIGNYTDSVTKDDLANRIDALEAMDVSEGFAEFASDAATAIAEATKRLNARILAIVEQEKAEEQRKQLEAEQKKNRINERLTNLVQIPLGLMGKSSSEIQKKIDSLKAFAVLEEDFEDRTEEAKTSLDQVISQLGMMLTQAKQLEEAQAKTEAERAANAVELNKQLPEDSPVKYDEVVHPSDCKGCPDCQGINCEVTNQACKEELESHQGRSQAMRNDDVFNEEPNQAKPLNEIMSALVYALTKEAARSSFVEFLENWDITEDEYEQVKEYWLSQGIKPYV